MCFQDFTCPKCLNKIEVFVYRWNTKTNCPCCNSLLKIEFDFYYGDDQEEYDCYDLITLEQNDNQYLEYSESKKKMDDTSEIDFILDDIRKACELGEIEEVILLSEKLKTIYNNEKK